MPEKTKLVRDLMISDVKTVNQKTSILDAVKFMTKQKIGALIIVDDEGHTAGIFTERDLLIKVVAVEMNLQAPVSAVMSSDLVCAQLHDAIGTIPDMMAKGGFRHVPVVDGFEPVGIISIRDVLQYMMKLVKA